MDFNSKDKGGKGEIMAEQNHQNQSAILEGMWGRGQILTFLLPYNF